jgi:hypothetical protein
MSVPEYDEREPAPFSMTQLLAACAAANVVSTPPREPAVAGRPEPDAPSASGAGAHRDAA